MGRAAAGRLELIDPYQALDISRAEPGVPASHGGPDHHMLVRRAIEEQLLDAVRSTTIVAYGGIQRRLYETVKRYVETVTGQFADTPELRRLMDAVYNRPLRESAKSRVSKALRERTPEDVVAMVLSMSESDDLLVDQSEQAEDELRIVCSLGVR